MAMLDEIRRIAEVEFASIVTDVAVMGVKLRTVLTDTSYVDIWVSKKLENRFGFHWERGHLDGTIYRYDNFPEQLGSTSRLIPSTFTAVRKMPLKLPLSART